MCTIDDSTLIIAKIRCVLKKEEYLNQIRKLLEEAEEIGVTRAEMLEALKEGESGND